MKKAKLRIACLSIGGVSGGSQIESVSMKMSQFLKCHSHCRGLGTILLKVKLSQRKTSFQTKNSVLDRLYIQLSMLMCLGDRACLVDCVKKLMSLCEKANAQCVKLMD